MRGLNPFERAHLMRWSNGEPADFYPAQERRAELIEMHAAGRVAKHIGSDTVLWPPTELGRLALRVCPVGEP